LDPRVRHSSLSSIMESEAHAHDSISARMLSKHLQELRLQLLSDIQELLFQSLSKVLQERSEESVGNALAGTKHSLTQPRGLPHLAGQDRRSRLHQDLQYIAQQNGVGLQTSGKNSARKLCGYQTQEQQVLSKLDSKDTAVNLDSNKEQTNSEFTPWANNCDESGSTGDGLHSVRAAGSIKPARGQEEGQTSGFCGVPNCSPHSEPILHVDKFPSNPPSVGVVPTTGTPQSRDGGQACGASEKTNQVWSPKCRSTPESLETQQAHELPSFSEFRQSPTEAISKAHKYLDAVTKRSDAEEKTGLARVVKSQKFSTIVAVLVIANCAWIGFETQKTIQIAYEELTTGIKIPSGSWRVSKKATNLCFAGVFLVELLLRIFAEKVLFWFGSEARWNLFDCFLVGSSLTEIVMSASNFSFARVLRLFRMVKMLRVLRMVPMCKSLRKMVISVCGCLSSLVWLTVLLGLIVYVSAICFMQIYQRELEGGSLRNSPYLSQLEDLYGTVSRAMLTLFTSISGGRDWQEAMDPIWHISSFYGLMFLLYIVFILFGVLNVVTGVFVDRALEIAAQDKDFVVLEEMQSRKQEAKDLTDFFNMLDADGDGCISLEEVTQDRGKGGLQNYMFAMQLDTEALLELFTILDTHQTGKLDIQTFIDGCMRIRGHARAIDLHAFLHESRYKFSTIDNYMESMGGSLQGICKHHGIVCHAPFSSMSA